MNWAARESIRRRCSARVYLHTWLVTGEPFFRSIVEETLDYVIREMVAPAGGFYFTQDADSEGEEGKFFVGWEFL